MTPFSQLLIRQSNTLEDNFEVIFCHLWRNFSNHDPTDQPPTVQRIHIVLIPEEPISFQVQVLSSLTIQTNAVRNVRFGNGRFSKLSWKFASSRVSDQMAVV
ncbi:hypothetical protein AJ79_10060 [Helicocarpus griseus UAMH5409]|uniref:Uncharacterized protein n=1 Tax=Helicocarpus griseus UAMH5409 TaxID=1447875 RepID=A0A2B7WFX7_9EURO|nr:hypothetical protein AJ79_10060 [Helicocarpus griseus UAMH5409]